MAVTFSSIMVRLIIISIFVGPNCFAQNNLQGDWLTTGIRSSFRLIQFRMDSVTSELHSAWRTYSLQGEELNIHCMDWTEKHNLYSSVYRIKSLSKDSLVLEALNDEAKEETKGLYSWPQQPGQIRLFRRELISMEISFDSISYTSRQPASHLISYYSPGSYLRIVINSNGVFTYKYHTVDTGKAKIGRRRIQWPEGNRDTINFSGHLNSSRISMLMGLLNKSNIQNIDQETLSTFPRPIHGEPTTLMVFKNGQALFTLTSRVFPSTIDAVIDFLIKLDGQH